MKDAVTSASLCARVTDAPALGGVKMYQVKISCKGKSTSMYKSKEDFRNVINMFKLVGAMASRNKGDAVQCQVCATCSAMPMIKVCDEESLNAFLVSVLDKLRKCTPEAIEECSHHNGIITILMDFLSVRHGKCFCDMPEGEESDASSADTPVQENDLDHPIAHCSLNRTLSQRFAAMDSARWRRSYAQPQSDQTSEPTELASSPTTCCCCCWFLESRPRRLISYHVSRGLDLFCKDKPDEDKPQIVDVQWLLDLDLDDDDDAGSQRLRRAVNKLSAKRCLLRAKLAVASSTALSVSFESTLNQSNSPACPHTHPQFRRLPMEMEGATSTERVDRSTDVLGASSVRPRSETRTIAAHVKSQRQLAALLVQHLVHQDQNRSDDLRSAAWVLVSQLRNTTRSPADCYGAVITGRLGRRSVGSLLLSRFGPRAKPVMLISTVAKEEPECLLLTLILPRATTTTTELDELHQQNI